MKPLETVGMREFAIKPSKYVRKFEDEGGGLLARHGEIVGIYIPITAWGLTNALKVWELYLEAYLDDFGSLPEEQQKAIQVFRRVLGSNETETARIKQKFFTDSAKEEFQNAVIDEH